MSSLKKIFTVVDDIPTINAVGINLPCFKALWMSDKNPDKLMYAAWLAYIYHVTALDSPFYNVDKKAEKIAETFLGKKNIKVPNEVLKCIELCEEFESFAEKRALDAAIQLSDSTSQIVMSLKKENALFEKLIKDIDDEMKTEIDTDIKIERMQKRQALQAALLTQADKSGKIISNMNKNVEELLALRKKVSTAAQEFEATNTNKLQNHMIDDLISNFVN